MKQKLELEDWIEKYFSKDPDHNYYTWTFTYDGMHENDRCRWKDDDLLNEYLKYFENGDTDLHEYEE
jgi:hypothetical protein